MNESDVNQRFIKYLDEKGIAYKDAAIILGNREQQIQQWKTNQRNIPLKHLITICIKYNDLNIKWLITGQGQMLDEGIEKGNIQDSKSEYLVCNTCEEKTAHIKTLNDYISTLKDDLHSLREEKGKKGTAHYG
jgi:hypothetical protein